jgi:15-cis-phytoene desaturase
MITPAMGALDPVLENLRTKHGDDLVSWMVGIQYFLYEDVPLVRGHMFYPDSPWALTSISQPQFWRDLGLFRERYGDGEVGGLLSIDVSDWNTPGMTIPKPAKMCTPDEIQQEIWAQLKAALNSPTDKVLTDELLHSAHLDDDLDYSSGTLPPVNKSRLLVHPPGSWATRPDPGTAIPNLVLAGDYIRTKTDLASMEGANEAARHAVNVILQRSGSTASTCQLWPLTEPAMFTRWKQLDAALHAHGRPHLFELAGIRDAARAADTLRRFYAFTGLEEIDDLLDKVRATSIVKGLLARLGVD